MPSSLTPTVFSSSTLWAAPSKEWTVAPKPKPGRKPQNDSSPLKDGNLDGKTRRIQNRAAQRAFRERRQSQLAELQARVQSFEKSETERYAALQNAAKRLKEENRALLHENQLLREKLERAEQQVMAQSQDRKEGPSSNLSSVILTSNKRIKLSATISHMDMPVIQPYLPPVGQTISSLESLDCVAVSKSTRGSGSHQPDEEHNSIVFSYADTKADLDSCNGKTSFSSCGLCNEVMPCSCREARESSDGSAASFNEENSTPMFSQAKHSVHNTSKDMLQTSILDNLPGYQPAVPLRRKRGIPDALLNSIFPVMPPPQSPSTARCTGDPSNCLACKDDAFGKAFCTAVRQSVAARSPCIDCPCNQRRSNVANPEDRCGTSTSLGHNASSRISSETMPTNEAWKRIKDHPNASFADLSLLAEVVVQRSKCTEPTVLISPVPDQVTPERTASPDVAPQPYSIQELLLSPDTKSASTEKRITSVSLMSPQQTMIIRCGRKGLCEVHTGGVQDALRLLDKKYP